MNSHIYDYLVIFEPEASGMVNVSVPDLPGCFTCGENMEHAAAMAKEAIELMVEGLIAEGKPVPEPTRTAMRIQVSA